MKAAETTLTATMTARGSGETRDQCHSDGIETQVLQPPNRGVLGRVQIHQEHDEHGREGQ
jgi:hypothetical protein